MSTTSLTFTEKSHTYEEDGIVVPSVTQILTLSGIDDISGIPIQNLQRAAERGTTVHQACQYLDEDDLVLDSLDPEIVGYVCAYQKFKEKYDFRPELIEYMTVGEVNGMRYGMTMDRLGRIETPEGEGRIVLDLKTASKPSKSWPIQTAAYVLGYSGEDVESRPARGVVHLKKDGTFSLLIHDLDQDFAVWRAAITLAYWRLKQ